MAARRLPVRAAVRPRFRPHSIVGGTLPLELFGREGYGARLGWASAARQFTSAFAPFALAFMMARTSVANSLWMLVVVAASGVIAFLAIALLRRRDGRFAFAIGGRPEEAR